MEVVRLEPGQSAPIDADCISLCPLADGRVGLTGSVLCGPESVALVDHPSFDDADAAEEASLVWAEAQGVSLLYVARES